MKTFKPGYKPWALKHYMSDICARTRHQPKDMPYVDGVTDEEYDKLPKWMQLWFN